MYQYKIHYTVDGDNCFADYCGDDVAKENDILTAIRRFSEDKYALGNLLETYYKKNGIPKTGFPELEVISIHKKPAWTKKEWEYCEIPIESYTIGEMEIKMRGNGHETHI